MEGLLVRRLVDARRRIVDAAAEVLHVTEDMTLAVLRHRLAEIRADAEEGRRRLFHRIALDRKAAQDDEAAPAQQDIVADARKALAELRQREVLSVDRDMIDAPVDDLADSGVDLGDLLAGQPMRERAGVLQLEPAPRGRLDDGPQRHRRRKRRFCSGEIGGHV
jgi:hypothetical protein